MISSNLNGFINGYNIICPEGTWKISEQDRQSLQGLFPTIQSVANSILDKECDAHGAFQNFPKSKYQDIADCKVQAGYSPFDTKLVNVFVKLPQVAAGDPNEILPGSIKKIDRCYHFVFKRADSVETPQLESFKPVARVKFNMETTRTLEELTQQFTNEMNSLTSLSHPHILRLLAGYEYVGTRKEVDGAKEPFNKIVLFQELFACDLMTMFLQELVELKKTERLNKAKHLIFQLIDAVTYLHSKEVAHCDLKLENVFIKKWINEKNETDSELVVGDVELAIPFDQKVRGRGTPRSIAPETLNNLDDMKVPENDVWALGCMLLILKEESPPLWAGLIELMMQYNQLIFSLKKTYAAIPKNSKKVDVVTSPLSPSKRNIDYQIERSVPSLGKRKDQEDQTSPTKQNKQSKSHLEPFIQGLKGLLSSTTRIKATSYAQLTKYNSDAAEAALHDLDFIRIDFEAIARTLLGLDKQVIGSNIEALEKLIETLDQLYAAHTHLLNNTWESLKAVEAPHGGQPSTYEQTVSYLIWGMLRPDPSERFTMEQVSALLAKFCKPAADETEGSEPQSVVQRLPLEPISTQLSDRSAVVREPSSSDSAEITPNLTEQPDFFEPRPAKALKALK